MNTTARIKLASAFLFAAACNPPEDLAATSEAPIESSITDLGLANAPTKLDTLEPGESYIPGLDERAPQAQRCVQGRAVVNAGTTTSSGDGATSRTSLLRKLGVSASGIPLNAAASLAVDFAKETSFGADTVHFIFHSSGSFSSDLVDVTVPRFERARVGECGYGYVSRATYEVAASVMITVSGLDASDTASLGCTGDRCNGIGVSAGTLSVGAGVQRVLTRNSVKVSIRARAGAIDGLPSFPSVSGSDPMADISEASRWLSAADAAIRAQLRSAQESERLPRGWTRAIDFRYYPGVDPEDLRPSVVAIAAIRGELETVDARRASWDAFGAADASGDGRHYAVLGAGGEAVTSLEKLRAQRDATIRALDERRAAVEAKRQPCARALRDGTSDASAKCAAAQDFVRDVPASGAATLEVRRVEPLAMTSNIDGRGEDDKLCPGSHQRLPTREEATLYLGPWSTEEGGVWVARASLWSSRVRIRDGKLEELAPYDLTARATVLCFPTGGVFE